MAQVELGSTSLISDPNLIAYYKLEDVTDSKNDFDLTNNDTVTFSAGKFNNAANFNGSSEFLGSSANKLGINTDVDMAFSFWLKPSAQTGSNTEDAMVSFNNDAHRLIVQYANVSGTFKVGVNTGAGFNGFNQTLPNGEYHHIVINYTQSGGEFEVFVDGVSLGTFNDTNKSTNIDGFYIAKQSNVESNFFPGQIDDVGVFTRVLTADEVDLIFNGPAVASSGGGVFLNNLI